MTNRLVLRVSFFAIWISITAAQAADWPQFRGPNCSGRPVNDVALPADLGPTTNVLWRAALPPGHSSPIVVGDRVYVTGVRQKHLVTIALERATGRVLWEVEAPARKLEKVHQIGSHAQSTPVADNERVISFFGSCGLFCYDRTGKLAWHRPMGPFNNDFGAASSPVLAGDRVILCQDHDQNSFLMALDKRTGQTIWRTERSDFLRGFCTPVLWNDSRTDRNVRPTGQDGRMDIPVRPQIVVAGTLRVAGYDLKTGKEIWTVRGIARTICSTPAIGADGKLFLGGWAMGGDPGEAIEVEPFDVVVKRLDKNRNGTLERNELTTGPMAIRFTQVDFDANGSITRAEYERFRELFKKGKNVIIAIRPGGKGDVTASHVAWTNNRQMPFCASPLYHNGILYTLKSGGLFASLDPNNGKPLKFARLPDTGDYYSSPVAGDGKIYVLSQRGLLMVVRAGRDWEVFSTSDFGEPVYATPAIADGRIYLRTAGHLYCFGAKVKDR